MKKVLCVLLALAMVFCFAACGKDETPSGQGQQTPSGQEQTQPPVSADPDYVGLELSFKNKTGAEITGLYLYESGAADKGNSICIANWPDKDANGDLYEFNAYLYRSAKIATYDLYVTFADGTDATWSGLTINNYDKFSLKGGVDPAKWEQEPVDAEDKPAMDALKATGRATDGYYPGYTKIDLEIKNKTSKKGESHAIKAIYVYADGASDKGANILANVYPNGMEEGAEYIFGYVIREDAKQYNLETVFDNDASVIYEATEFSTPDGGGNFANELSIQSDTDPDVWKVTYDDGEACRTHIQNATVNGVCYVNEEAPEEHASLDSFIPTIKVK